MTRTQRSAETAFSVKLILCSVNLVADGGGGGAAADVDDD